MYFLLNIDRELLFIRNFGRNNYFSALFVLNTLYLYFMRILLLGSGGREHALAYKLAQSPSLEKLFIAPGNPGTAALGTNIPISITEFQAIGVFCLNNQVNMIIVGPEEPLVKGIYDYFKADEALKNIAFIGPSQYGAQLEGSKAFAKAFMQRHNIPTAAYAEFTADNYEQGVSYLKQHALPVVLKADGLAAGKGVIICETTEQALMEFEAMIKEAKFGDAGNKVVVEAFLSGIELSVFALTDGRDYILLPEAKDYKRIGEADSGLNTGGMGAISPVPFADNVFMQKVIEKVVAPTIHGLYKESIDYTGFVFFGLIKVNDEPYVIEYNCRMGDPETEVVMPRLKGDLVLLLNAAANGGLAGQVIEADERCAATVMVVSGGYPGNFKKGYEVFGLENFENSPGLVFQAGTAPHNNKVVTAGGRVLCITSFGNTVNEAVQASVNELKKIYFTDMYYRRDIGWEFQ